MSLALVDDHHHVPHNIKLGNQRTPRSNLCVVIESTRRISHDVDSIDIPNVLREVLIIDVKNVWEEIAYPDILYIIQTPRLRIGLCKISSCCSALHYFALGLGLWPLWPIR